MERKNYKGGKLDGLCELWYPNGQLSERFTCCNGKIHGLCEDWYENGQLDKVSEEWNEDGSKIEN
jgi:antitoxin component YwqK of YwqJK toxin-antitoxin module